MFDKLKAHYRVMQTPNQLQDLTLDMVRRDGKGPKLRAKGAETRNVVPFVADIALEVHAEHPTDASQTVVHMTRALLGDYVSLTVAPFDDEYSAKLARRCCLLYSAMRAKADREGQALLWRVKPKFHT